MSTRPRLSLLRRLSLAPIIVGLLFVGAPLAAEELPSAAQLMDDLMWSRGPIGGPFTLVDHTGKIRSDTEFRGKLMVIYFGYTYCPDVCPTDLMAISQAIDALGTAGEMVQPIFITVDPERDTIPHLAEYVSAFHPRLIGLTGSPEQIRRVALSYKAYYAKFKDERGDDYVIDHTGVIYLIGRDGQYLGFVPPQTKPDRLIEILRRQLAG
jgi:cytochrome oxidase Cu insertion factor (SCO1/SenC/PrrC family)